MLDFFMKEELSEILVSFLGLILIFLVPSQYSLYNITLFGIAITIAFLARICLQKYFSKKSKYETDKKLLFISLFISLISFGTLKWAVAGGLKNKTKKVAAYGVVFNIIMGISFLLMTMFSGTMVLLSQEIFIMTFSFFIISNVNFVFAISNMLPVGNLDGKILYNKDRKLFWALFSLSLCTFFLLLLWYRFSIIYQFFNINF